MNSKKKIISIIIVFFLLIFIFWGIEIGIRKNTATFEKSVQITNDDAKELDSNESSVILNDNQKNGDLEIEISQEDLNISNQAIIEEKRIPKNEDNKNNSLNNTKEESKQNNSKENTEKETQSNKTESDKKNKENISAENNKDIIEKNNPPAKIETVEKKLCTNSNQGWLNFYTKLKSNNPESLFFDTVNLAIEYGEYAAKTFGYAYVYDPTAQKYEDSECKKSVFSVTLYIPNGDCIDENGNDNPKIWLPATSKEKLVDTFTYLRKKGYNCGNKKWIPIS